MANDEATGHDTTRALDEADAPDDPIVLFGGWYDDVTASVATDALEPIVMTLATVSADGRPSARIVLMKGFDEAEITDLPFRRGDANNDGQLNISDPSFLLNAVFRGGEQPPCSNAADANDDGDVNLSDAMRIFSYLFQVGDNPVSVPPSPGLQCGFDATPNSSAGCEDSTCLER